MLTMCMTDCSLEVKGEKVTLTHFESQRTGIASLRFFTVP